jgi:hypothetical protein
MQIFDPPLICRIVPGLLEDFEHYLGHAVTPQRKRREVWNRSFEYIETVSFCPPTLKHQ